VSDRTALTGILFVLKTGIPWAYLRAEIGCGSGMTCWRRLRDWYHAGVWRRLHQVLLEKLAQADRIDWDRAALASAAVPAPGGPRNGQELNGSRQTGHEAPLVVDAHGIPLAVLVSAANVHDSKIILAIVDAIEPIRAKTRGRPRRRPHKLHADKDYDYHHLRLALRERRIIPASPAVVSSPRTAWDATGGWSNGRSRDSIASGA
jgi:transposase